MPAILTEGKTLGLVLCGLIWTGSGLIFHTIGCNGKYDDWSKHALFAALLGPLTGIVVFEARRGR